MTDRPDGDTHAGQKAAIQPAMAHHSSVGSTAGIPIPSLVRGQMAVMAENKSAILDLADREPFQDETFLQLRNFIEIQSFRCLWSLVPGSIDDEASPFNECSHAYLSATRALLLHMQGMRGDRSRVQALVDRIELQMAINNAALVLCRYSDEPFNTADVISPPGIPRIGCAVVLRCRRRVAVGAEPWPQGATSRIEDPAVPRVASPAPRPCPIVSSDADPPRPSSSLAIWNAVLEKSHCSSRLRLEPRCSGLGS
jgi:hypothetical protein